MATTISALDVSKQYDGVDALDGVSLEIEAGEIFALIGPNGAGKTTFVRSITGTVTPTSGKVRLFENEPRAIDRTRLGVLPQSYHPPGRLTGREILQYYSGLYEDARPVEEVLEDVGMETAGDRWYERLSGGQQRRICVAATLVNDPELLVLDEPTTGIDPTGRRQLWRLLEALRDAGRTVLLTTHDMTEAAMLGDRVGLLGDGRLLASGKPEELIGEYAGEGQIVVTVAGRGARDELDELSRPIVHRDDRIVIEEVSREEMPAVIRSLDETDIEYSRVSWEQPTLEDVFFTLTDDGGTSK